MMNKRLTSLLLVLALSLSVGMVSALADEETTPVTAADTEGGITVTVETPAASGTDTQTGEEIPVALIPETKANIIPFAEVQKLIRKNSPTYGALQANIAAIDEAPDRLSALNSSITRMQNQLGNVEAELAVFEGRDDLTPDEEALKSSLLGEKIALQTGLQQAQSGISGISALAAQDTTQLELQSEQFIMGCETMYIKLVDLKIQEAALERQLAALDRTLAALKIRQEGGQVSELQVRQAESGRGSLSSGLATLRMNMDNLRLQMEMMLGEELTGTVEVAALPKVTAEELDALDPEKDLKLVLNRSLSVQAAEDNWDTVRQSNPGGDLGDYLLDAADCGVESAELQAEVQYRSLYAQLQDDRQALAAVEAALEVAQLAYDAEALKYERGSISDHVLLDAKDTLQNAKDAVAQAENKLFDTYNQYQWAVKHGVFAG